MPDLESSRPTPNSGNSPGPHHGYDPNQPRVPSGHSDGGQWTKTGSGTPTIARREAVVDHSKQESWGSYVDGYRADGSLAEQRVFNRDGSRIVSEFKPPDDPGDWDERHTVVLPDGTKFAFENSGNVQRIFDGEGNLVSATEWTDDGPRPLPIGQLAFSGPRSRLRHVLPARPGSGTGPERRRPHVFHLAFEPQGSQPHRGLRLQRKEIRKA